MTNLFNDGQRLWKQYQQQLLPLQLKSQLKKILTEQRLQFQNLAESVWWCSGESPGQYIRGLFVLAIIGVEAYHVKVTTFETIRLATKWWNSTCEWPTVSNDLGVLLSMASIFTTVRELTTDMPLEVPMLAASELIPHDSNDDMAKKLSIFQCTMRSHCKNGGSLPRRTKNNLEQIVTRYVASQAINDLWSIYNGSASTGSTMDVETGVQWTYWRYIWSKGFWLLVYRKNHSSGWSIRAFQWAHLTSWYLLDRL
jgi:hypothetical protein